jgi:hypothetical protein
MATQPTGVILLFPKAKALQITLTSYRKGLDETRNQGSVGGNDMEKDQENEGSGGTGHEDVDL